MRKYLVLFGEAFSAIIASVHAISGNVEMGIFFLLFAILIKNEF
jgi:hypothetical protein